MVSVIPKTADKIYKRRVDADEEVIYVKPKSGDHYIRIHLHKKTGKLYNSYADVISADHFAKSIRKGTTKLSAADWEKIKKNARR